MTMVWPDGRWIAWRMHDGETHEDAASRVWDRALEWDAKAGLVGRRREDAIVTMASTWEEAWRD